jgi:outer membrane protein assembly factor BamA
VRAGAIDPCGKRQTFTPDPTIDSRVQRVPLEDRFRIGGVNSLRGYAESKLYASGGLALLLANAELRVPVIGPLGAELFADAGNVWSRPTQMRLSDFALRVSDAYYAPPDLRYVIGAGLRLNLPFGPLRCDVSWSSQRDPGLRDRLVAPTNANPDLRDRKPQIQVAIGPAF